MRLILLSLLIGFITYSDTAPYPLFYYTDQERVYGLIALCGYLLCEGIIYIRLKKHVLKVARKKSELHPPVATASEVIKDIQAPMTEEGEALKAQIKTLTEKLEQAEEKIKQQTTVSNRPAHSQEALNHQAIVLLGLLQQKGRLVDFVMEDIAGIDDARVGSVARIVHEGCSKVLKEHFSIHPIFSGAEGQTIKLQPPFEPSHYRLSGKVNEHPPYSGRIVHKGWKSTIVRLPQPIENSDTRRDLVIAPAEVDCNG